jgi:hypothetical protein
MTQLPRTSYARSVKYSVELQPSSPPGAPGDGWQWLRVVDINGVILHNVIIRADPHEIATEVAVAVERAEAWWREQVEQAERR